MSIEEIFSQLHSGTIVSIVVILLSLVEIAPIRISPLNWIGKRLNKSTHDKVDAMNQKLDEHIAQSYRSKILNFQEMLITDGIGNHSQEAWKEVIKASEAYEDYVKENEIENGLCEIAIEFIKESYKECLKTRSFANLPTKKESEQ